MIIEHPAIEAAELVEDIDGSFLRPKPGIEGLQGGLEQIPRQKLKKNPVREVLAPAPGPDPADQGTALTDEEHNKPLPVYESYQR